MAYTFNPVMKNCELSLYGRLYIHNKIQANNILPFWFTLPYILSQLGTHHITSTQSNGYVYYRFRFGDKDYDLRDKQQFLKLRDTVINAYNNRFEFYKHTEKTKNE